MYAHSNMTTQNEFRRLSLWPWLAAALLSFAWLQPHHQPPWSGFHEDAAMAVWMSFGAMLLIVSVLRSGLQWDALAVSLFGLALVVAAQSFSGLIASPGQAILFMLHLLGIACCYTVARSWYQRSPYALLDILFAGIAIAAIGNIAIALHQWLRLMPTEIDSLGGIWLMDIGDVSRYSGNVAQPNELATLISWGMLSGLWAYFRKQLRFAWLIPYLGFLALGAALTQSRVGLLEVALITLGMAIYRREFGGWRLAALMFSVLCFQIFLIAMLPSIMELLLLDGEARALTSMTRDPARLRIYSMALEAISLSPWWGYGATHQATAQWAILDHAPYLNAYWMQSHNWILDLMLWFGVPIGVGLTIAVCWWGYGVIRHTKEPHVIVVLLAFGCFSLHATVELLHWVANFSLVAALFAGVLSAHTHKKPLLSTGWGFNLTLAGILTIGVVGAVVDYIRLERNFIQLRAEQLKLRTDISEPPDAWVLYHLADSMRIGRIPIATNLDKPTLAWMENNERASPNSRTAYHLILSLGLNGEHERARQWMRQLSATSPEGWVREYRRIWSIRKRQFPEELRGLEWTEATTRCTTNCGDSQ